MPYLRVDGVRVADDWTDLTDSSLQAPINVDEFGQPSPFGFPWTATSANGTPLSDHCNDWGGTAGMGRVGCTDGTDQSWTSCFLAACSTFQAELVCFER